VTGHRNHIASFRGRHVADDLRGVPGEHDQRANRGCIACKSAAEAVEVLLPLSALLLPKLSSHVRHVRVGRNRRRVEHREQHDLGLERSSQEPRRLQHTF
jgi:hypothetical protein